MNKIHNKEFTLSKHFLSFSIIILAVHIMYNRSKNIICNNIITLLFYFLCHYSLHSLITIMNTKTLTKNSIILVLQEKISKLIFKGNVFEEIRHRFFVMNAPDRFADQYRYIDSFDLIALHLL